MLISLQQLNLKSKSLIFTLIKELIKKYVNQEMQTTLIIIGNLFTSLPEPVTHLFNLKMLDISKNKITNLPKELASLRALEHLVVDVSLMTYPSKGYFYTFLMFYDILYFLSCIYLYR